jgi:phosphatidylglycerophosphatase C
MSAAPPIALFDFDHTLVRHDSFARFARRLIQRDWWRAAAAVGISPALAPFLPLRSTRAVPMQTLLWLATFGLDDELFGRHLDAHVTQLVRDPESLVHRDGIERLREHQRTGHRVVIATGALEGLARAICGALGLGELEVVGSSLQSWGGGMMAREHCFGERKVTMLRARGFPPPWPWVYTDSASDLPLLRHAGEGFLVNPTPRSVARARRALAQPPRVLRWR